MILSAALNVLELKRSVYAPPPTYLRFNSIGTYHHLCAHLKVLSEVVQLYTTYCAILQNKPRCAGAHHNLGSSTSGVFRKLSIKELTFCLLYTSDAADEEDSVDLGGRRIIKKKKKTK